MTRKSVSLVALLTIALLAGRLFLVAADGSVKYDNQVKPFNTNIREEIGNIKGLTRNLRGGANPAEIIPKVHTVVKSQLEIAESMHKMYQDGQVKALASSIKNLIGGVPLGLPKPNGESAQMVALEEQLKQVDSDEINSTTREVPNEFEFKRQGWTVALFQG